MIAPRMYQVRLSDELGDALERYAERHGIPVSDAIRQAVSEMIEDELDRDAYRRARCSFERVPETCTQEELGKRLGFIRCIMWSIQSMSGSPRGRPAATGRNCTVKYKHQIGRPALQSR